MRCRNDDGTESEWICLCPMPDRGYGVRQVLAQPFINGWLTGELVRAANALAADVSASEERLWRMLKTLEDEANGAFCMWRSCQ